MISKFEKSEITGINRRWIFFTICWNYIYALKYSYDAHTFFNYTHVSDFLHLAKNISCRDSIIAKV